ncbi:hypothetical protein BV898_15909 [Hypsibius exemplaris]|uniref:AMP-dependent synthetase/ligase domain-containing protein n=1 Tax=Hypsibius exemplaris TaxID=2072580 RepID=A0A9X6RL71_HYPEX|nr:hypothetical protein BV898_15909 [Hypsibius exemplaris]
MMRRGIYGLYYSAARCKPSQPHYCPKRGIQIHYPDSHRSRPVVKLVESYIHVPSEIPYLATTLARLIDFRAEETGDRVGYVIPFQGIRKTYAEFKVDVEDLACGLIALGLQPGDRLG